MTFLKETMYLLAYVACVLFIAKCSYNQNPEDTKTVAEEHNDAKFNNSKQEIDAQFLVNAAEMNLEGIQLGKLAQKNGSTTHVVELGKKMEAAHTKSQRGLTQLAKSKSITIPTEPTNSAMDAYKKLNKNSGSDFDKAYADRMVRKHKTAIVAFEKASKASNDPDIKNWAIATLSDLRTHLDHSIECQKECNKM